MDSVQFWTIVIGFVANLIILLTSIVQVYKLKKELKDVKIIINNPVDLQSALKKPLEGIWKVCGSYSKYHNVCEAHKCTGFAVFCWDNTNKRYDVYYTYSVRKEKDSFDLVTAICSGIALSDENGKIKRKLVIQFTIDSRSAVDGVNNCFPTFEFITSKINETENRINEMDFIFKNSISDGVIRFVR